MDTSEQQRCVPWRSVAEIEAWLTRVAHILWPRLGRDPIDIIIDYTEPPMFYDFIRLLTTPFLLPWSMPTMCTLPFCCIQRSEGIGVCAETGAGHISIKVTRVDIRLYIYGMLRGIGSLKFRDLWDFLAGNDKVAPVFCRVESGGRVLTDHQVTHTIKTSTLRALLRRRFEMVAECYISGIITTPDQVAR